MIYRRREQTVEAYNARALLIASQLDPDHLPARVRENAAAGNIVFDTYENHVHVQTADGQVTAIGDDMVVFGPGGELFMFSAADFAKNYEVA